MIVGPASQRPLQSRLTESSLNLHWTLKPYAHEKWNVRLKMYSNCIYIYIYIYVCIYIICVYIYIYVVSSPHDSVLDHQLQHYQFGVVLHPCFDNPNFTDPKQNWPWQPAWYCSQKPPSGGQGWSGRLQVGTAEDGLLHWHQQTHQIRKKHTYIISYSNNTNTIHNLEGTTIAILVGKNIASSIS